MFFRCLKTSVKITYFKTFQVIKECLRILEAFCRSSIIQNKFLKSLVTWPRMATFFTPKTHLSKFLLMRLRFSTKNCFSRVFCTSFGLFALAVSKWFQRPLQVIYNRFIFLSSSSRPSCLWPKGLTICALAEISVFLEMLFVGKSLHYCIVQQLTSSSPQSTF